MLFARPALFSPIFRGAEKQVKARSFKFKLLNVFFVVYEKVIVTVIEQIWHDSPCRRFGVDKIVVRPFSVYK